ncbi:MAG: DNA methyltransferase, partial [Verrucomicrobiota bacterium]
TAGELTGGRKEGSAGLKSPRAGAGRTSKGRANGHPTIKPIALMRWLVRLVTPPGGTVLDPFMGSGYRIAKRLGWLNGATRIEEAGLCLQEFIPRDLTYDMHLYLIQHGRQTCKARNPRCEACPIASWCSSRSEGKNGAAAK